MEQHHQVFLEKCLTNIKIRGMMMYGIS